MSNVPALTISSTGVSVPESVDIRNGVLADTNVSFGSNLNITTSATPQAYLADNLTQNIVDQNAAIAYMISQVDPATSEGRMQDGIGRIYYMSRKGATASVVTAQCTGQIGVTLPAGSLAQDDAGNLWSSSGDVTFTSTGAIDVQFSCVTLGPVALGAGQLTRIAQTVSGWDSITNVGAATIGNDTETRANFEIRRAESVAKNAHGSVEAIRSNVWDVDGVVDVFAYDNFTNSILNYGSTSYALAPHSIYVAVSGGADSDVANAIYEKKSGGCDMNGNTSQIVYDTTYDYPYPQYTIKFNRPTPTPILFSVQIKNNSSLPANIIALVKSAITATFNGTDGSQRARIGGDIYASNFYYWIASIAKSVAILSIKIGTVTANLDSLSIGIDQAPTIQDSNILVTLV